MFKISDLLKINKEKFVIPRGIQDVIPIKRIWRDGRFLIGTNKYSKTFKFADINYAVASENDKEEMFLDYMQILNSFECETLVKISIINSKINEQDVENNIKIGNERDKLDRLRKEYNMLIDEGTRSSNGIVQEKYITITIKKKSLDEARTTFRRISIELSKHLKKLNSVCMELDSSERLKILHNFYRMGEENDFSFDMIDNMKKGHSFKDYISPDSFEFKKDYFKMGNKFGRVIFLKEYASFIKDSMVSEITDISKNLIITIDISPVATEKAIKEAERILLGVETNKTNYMRKQNENNNFLASIPYDMEQQEREAREFLNDLMTRDQRMFLGLITIVFTADTEKELENITDAILTIARKNLCQFGILKFQQLDGLNTTLPIGVENIETLRTLTTESLAVFIPFKVQEIQHLNRNILWSKCNIKKYDFVR